MENTATSRFMNMTNIAESPSTGTQSSNSFFSSTLFKIIAAILILALLGLNVFNYLAKGTDLLGNILSKATDKVPGTTKQVLQKSITGTQLAADIAAGRVENTANAMGVDSTGMNVADDSDSGNLADDTGAGDDPTVTVFDAPRIYQ